jgi:quercetin dioxygenase-like cupin family protein
MRRASFALVVLVAVLWIGSSAVAQTPGTRVRELVLNPLAPSGGTGIRNGPLIDRAEIRVSRVDVEPNGVRNVHSHDDVQYHLFIPMSAGIRFEAESQKPLDVAAWQAQFLQGGTKHGFRNAGGATVTIMEIFVKK